MLVLPLEATFVYTVSVNELFTPRFAPFSKLFMFVPPHVVWSAYTFLHLRTTQGVLLLLKYENVIQAELGVRKTMRRRDLIPKSYFYELVPMI